MGRAHVAVLLGLAVLLVFDGPRPIEAPVATAVERPSPGFGASEIGEQLARLNSALSERERHRIAAAVMKFSGKYGLDPRLVTAVLKVESTARPWVRSPAGAVGLMQVMPHMANPRDVAGNLTTIESNIEAGCVILSDNIRRLGENDGISAYFWGSDIRGVAYLQRVQAARAAIRRQTES